MRRISKTTLYLVLFCVFLLAVNVSLGYFLIRDSSAAIRTQIENRMLDVSNTAAAMLDGDVLKNLRAEDKNTAEYQAVLKTLSCFESNIGLEYIYCVRDMGDKSFGFMIDPDPESPGAFGSPVPYTDALYQASMGTPAVDQEPYTDQWGRFYSAYSPVYDSEHHIGGIVAVDFSVEWYEHQISNQIITTLAISGVSLVFAALMIAMITSRYRKRFHQLFNEMNLISNGIETLVHEVTPGADTGKWQEEETALSNDEIQNLGNKIHALQNKLSEQVSLVRAQAYIDTLTGFGNRTAYEDHVKQLDEEIENGTAKFAIAVFDLNGLKQINDICGHEKGDEAIRKAADMISRAFPGGKQYRIGGDEFIVIVEEWTADMQARLDGIQENEEGVSISAGYAVFSSDTDVDYHMVFNRADAAMYDEKRVYYTTHKDRRRN